MHLLQLVILGTIAAASVIAVPQTAQQRQEVSQDVVNKALSDKRYLLRQLKCATGEAPCDLVGRRLKSLAPLVLRGACPQCTPNETRLIQHVLAHVQKNYPKEWSKIINQYAG